MGDDEAALVRLWREKRGEVEPEDLSGNLIVHLGLATENLNRGSPNRAGHNQCPKMAATSDPEVDGGNPRRSPRGGRRV
jgi:hypothetical protein